jgi:hypothetical protein
VSQTVNELECSAGTIGARVKNGTNVCALENSAHIGSLTLQPGLYDTDCLYSEDNVMGSLSAYVPLYCDGSENTVVAAIALSDTELLGNSTPQEGYGVPSSTVETAHIDMPVMKYGRTTGLTKGTITGVDASVWVTYDSGKALFVHQIVASSRKPFIKPGDSGPLLVTDPDRNPFGLGYPGGDAMAENEKQATLIQQAIKRHSERLLSIPGVVGVAPGVCEGGPCIHIYVEKRRLCTQTLKEMIEALEDAKNDHRVGVIVLTGAGEKFFCSIAAEHAKFAQVVPKVGSFEAGLGAACLGCVIG